MYFLDFFLKYTYKGVKLEGYFMKILLIHCFKRPPTKEWLTQNPLFVELWGGRKTRNKRYILLWRMELSMTASFLWAENKKNFLVCVSFLISFLHTHLSMDRKLFFFYWWKNLYFEMNPLEMRVYQNVLVNLQIGQIIHSSNKY